MVNNFPKAPQLPIGGPRVKPRPSGTPAHFTSLKETLVFSPVLVSPEEAGGLGLKDTMGLKGFGRGYSGQHGTFPLLSMLQPRLALKGIYGLHSWEIQVPQLSPAPSCSCHPGGNPPGWAWVVGAMASRDPDPFCTVLFTLCHTVRWPFLTIAFIIATSWSRSFR